MVNYTVVATPAEQITELSPSEWLMRNRNIAGFDNAARALYTALRELVENGLDACEASKTLPDVSVTIRREQQDKKDQQKGEQKQDQQGKQDRKPPEQGEQKRHQGQPRPQTPEERADQRFRQETGMPKERAMQLLDALEQNEKTEQRRLLALKRAQKKKGKDW